MIQIYHYGHLDSAVQLVKADGMRTAELGFLDYSERVHLYSVIQDELCNFAVLTIVVLLYSFMIDV